MIVSLVTAPTVNPVSVSEAKTHMRIDFSDDDTYIGTLINTATKYLENVTRRKFITQTWKYFLHDWPEEDYIVIPFGKLQSVTHVKYTDTDGTVNTDFNENDEWTADIYSDPGRVVLKYGETYPGTTLATATPIEIQFVCGYGTAGSNVPDEILIGIKMIVAELYERRETNIVGLTQTKLDMLDNLIASYRLWY